VGLERGPLSLVSTTEELLGGKSSGSGLEIREYGRRDPSRWPRGTFHQQTLALTSLISGGGAVGIVRSRTQATQFSFLVMPMFNNVPQYEDVQGRWGISPHIRLCSRQRWMGRFISVNPLDAELGKPPVPVWTLRRKDNSLPPYGIEHWFCCRRASSPSLYRLSYPRSSIMRDNSTSNNVSSVSASHEQHSTTADIHTFLSSTFNFFSFS
jgi:hypothetical protein